MPNVKYYSDVKIIKKPLKQRIKSVLRFFLFFLIVAGCFVSASYLSSALTVGNLGAFIVYGDTKKKITQSALYAVTLGTYNTFEEAEKVAIASTIQGASGYVWESDWYWVIGSIYRNRTDAEKVVENLNETNYETEIKEINFPSVTLDFDMYASSDMPTIDKSFEVFEKVYDELYNFSIRFDKKEINNLAISSSLSDRRGELKGLIIDVQNLINKSSSVLSKVQSYLIRLDELLDQTIIRTIDNSSTGYSLKYAIASVTRLKYELFVELA